MSTHAAEGHTEEERRAHDEHVARSIVNMVIEVLGSQRYNYALLPLLDHLQVYRARGQQVGGFLYALLTKDVADMMARADNTNLWLLPIYYAWCQNELPAAAWGSPNNVRTWQASFRDAPRQEEEEGEETPDIDDPMSTGSFV